MLARHHNVQPERIYGSDSMCRAAAELMNAGFRYSIRMQDVLVQQGEFMAEAYLRTADDIMTNVRNAGGRVFLQEDLLLAERRLFSREGCAVTESGPAETWFVTINGAGDYAGIMARTDGLRHVLPYPVEYFCANCTQKANHIHAVMTGRFPATASWMHGALRSNLDLFGYPNATVSVSPLQKPTKASLLYIYRQSRGIITHWTMSDVIPSLEYKKNALGAAALGQHARPKYKVMQNAIDDGCTPALLSLYDPNVLTYGRAAVAANSALYTSRSRTVPIMVIAASQKEAFVDAMLRRLPIDDAELFMHEHTADDTNVRNYRLQPFVSTDIRSVDPQEILDEMGTFADTDEYGATISRMCFVGDDAIDTVDWAESVNVARSSEEVRQVVNYLFDSL
jgi:hypothetical protein